MLVNWAFMTAWNQSNQTPSICANRFSHMLHELPRLHYIIICLDETNNKTSNLSQSLIDKTQNKKR